MLKNVGGPELLILFVMIIPLFVLWIMGVIKLFERGYRTLGWIAVAGIIVPIIGIVGYAGWFVEDRSDAT